jgi:hypothetical protein
VAKIVTFYGFWQCQVALCCIRSRLFCPDNPEICRTGCVAGTRKLVFPKAPFIMPYRVNGQSLRIYHGRKFSEIASLSSNEPD